MPRLTIAIPTYNRANFLKRSLASALGQTYHDVEILVCDNASTDETSEVVRSFGDRVRYHRNPENIGMWPNFVLAADLATGDYFSWLQDDDLIHRDFAKRAVEAFGRSKEVTVYIPYNISTDSTSTFYSAYLYGPLIGLNWMQEELRIINGILLTPLSLFRTCGMPPGLALRADTARRVVNTILPDCLLYNERIILAAAAAEGQAAIDPWGGAIFYMHPNQSHRQESDNVAMRWTQWRLMARTLCTKLDATGQAWEKEFLSLIDESDVSDRRRWIDGMSCPIEADHWSEAHPLAEQIRIMVGGPVTETEARPGHDSNSHLLRKGLRQLTPPIVWSALKGARAYFKMKNRG